MLALAAAALVCPVENASYQLRGAPGVTLRFHPTEVGADWPSGLAMALRVTRTQRTYWALPWQGGTDGRMNVRWIRRDSDNLPADANLTDRSSEWLATDPTYAFIDGVPHSGTMAPAHLLFPHLQREIWMATTAVVRDSLPTAFFDLTGCSGKANARVVVDLPKIR